MAKRMTLTFSTDERNRGLGRANTVFINVSDDTTPEAVQTWGAGVLAPFIKGKLTSISQQVFSADKTGLPEGLPGNLVKLAFKSPIGGGIEQLSWVFGVPDKSEADLAAIFANVTGDDAVTFLNRYGNPLGDMIRATQTPLSL